MHNYNGQKTVGIASKGIEIEFLVGYWTNNSF